MRFKERRETTVLGVLAAALGIFLVGDGGTSAAGLAPMIKPAEMRVVAHQAPDAACRAVLDASDKLFTTPYHVYMTQATAGVANGKPVSSETVSVGGAQYVLSNGKWIPSLLSTEDLKAMDQRNRTNAKNVSCHYVRDELVNGESAALYSMHSESPHSKSDSQSWVSKSKGLILRQEIDLGSGASATHLSIRYEYSNVQVPKL